MEGDGGGRSANVEGAGVAARGKQATLRKISELPSFVAAAASI